jgi:hypothetical protein
VTLKTKAFSMHPSFFDHANGMLGTFRQNPANTLISIFLSGLQVEECMNKKQRILICSLILLLDLAVFFLPLSAIFLVYVIWQNPQWFREFLQQLDQPNRSA